MGLLDHAVANTDVADLVILANVETKRDRMQEATPSALASMIGGAPEREITQRLTKMMFLGLLGRDRPMEIPLPADRDGSGAVADGAGGLVAQPARGATQELRAP
jgi:hypothetical protein